MFGPERKAPGRIAECVYGGWWHWGKLAEHKEREKRLGVQRLGEPMGSCSDCSAKLSAVSSIT
eukprot:3857836-Pleurochrysis_carterae.AAC.1